MSLYELDPLEISFTEKKSEILTNIRNTNQDLKGDIENYENNKKNTEILSLRYLTTVWFETLNKIPGTIKKISANSQDIEPFLNNFEKAGNELQTIYKINLPSNFQPYKSVYAEFTEKEIENNKVFSDIKDKIINLEPPLPKTEKLIAQLETTQTAFENCLNKINKKQATYGDLATCEENLAIDNLKTITYNTELSNLLSDDFLTILTNLTNEIYTLDKAINKLAEKTR